MVTTTEREARVMSTEEPDAEAVGRRIALARRERGLKQREAADSLGVIPRTWQFYEAGRIPWERLDEIAAIVEKPKDWILYGVRDATVDVRFPGDLPRELRDELANRHDEVVGRLDAIESLLRSLQARERRR